MNKEHTGARQSAPANHQKSAPDLLDNLAALRIDRKQAGNSDRAAVRHNYKRWLRSGAGMFAALLLAIAGYRFLLPPVHEVEVAIVFRQTPSQSTPVLTASGYVVAQRLAAVASSATGRLVAIGVAEGDQVAKGQLLARIDDREIRAGVARAQAQVSVYEAELPEARRNLERQQALYERGATPQVTLDAASTRYQHVVASIDLAKAQLAEAKVALENTFIRAPFAGTVVAKSAEIGEMISPIGAGLNARAAVVTLADLGSLIVESDVSEANIDKIWIGQACEIRLDAYPQRAYAGSVAKLIPSADRAKATIPVKVAFDAYDELVLPQMGAKVQFLGKTPSRAGIPEPAVLLLPQRAVSKRGGRHLVFRIDAGKAVAVPVTLGEPHGEFIEVRSGLAEGDRIIANASAQIENGAAVKIR